MEKLLFWLTRKRNFSCKSFCPSCPYYLLCKDEATQAQRGEQTVQAAPDKIVSV